TSSIFFNWEEDDVLGGIFTMIPLFNLYDSEMNYDKMREIAQGYLDKGKITSHVVLEAAPAVRHRATTYVSWGSTYKFRQGKLAMHLKEFATPTGKPGFVARSVWVDPGYGADTKPVYCYFTDRVREDGSSIDDGDTEVDAPVGAPIPRD
ncbi:hypothetical protein K2X33_05960, partial [bacterium]|nr:hypothetical protein [bacterium]